TSARSLGIGGLCACRRAPGKRAANSTATATTVGQDVLAFMGTDPSRAVPCWRWSTYGRRTRAQRTPSAARVCFGDALRVPSLLRPHRDDPEADVVVAPLRLEPLPEGGAGGPGLVRPAAAPARAGTAAVPVLRRRGLRVVQVRVGASGQPGMEPVAAPL